MQISAAVVQEVGGPFTLTQVDLQDPAPDEVVSLEIAGAGICHTDIAVQHGHLPFPLPGILGHEGSGTVVSVGAGVTTVAVGDHVAISFNSLGAPFALTEVELQEPAPDEVVVEIAGAGICHTDIAVQHGHLPFPLPGVLGHEGSGTVVEVGADVTSIAVGDDVAISFNSCGACPTCSKGQPAYCHNFLEYNFGGVRSDGSSGLASAGTKLGANFFGQSSLATHALAHERNVVKLPPGAPVELVGPLGCGIQTGAGAVLNSLDVHPGSTVVIAGAGAVGLSAVMAAVVREAASIIAVDLHESRRVLATELGATHAIDPQAGPLAEQIREIAPAGARIMPSTPPR